MKQTEFFLDNREKIIELLIDGYTVGGINEELCKNFPKVDTLFEAEKTVELSIKNFNLSNFIKNDSRCYNALIKGELARENRKSVTMQNAAGQRFIEKDKLSPKKRNAERNLLAKHRNIIKSSMLSHDQIVSSIGESNFDGDNSIIEIDLTNKDECKKEDPLDDLVPITYIGELRDIVKRFTPLGYSLEQLADVAGTSPEILKEVIEECPELKQAVNLAKHLLFEDIAVKTFKAIMPGTNTKSKFVVSRDTNDNSKAIATLSSFVIEEYKGSPDILFKMYKSFGEKLGIDTFSNESSNTNTDTGVLAVPENKSKSEWESQAKQEQEGLRDVEEKS